MGSVIITARIPKRLKEEVDRYGIRISEVVRRALEEEVRRRKLEEARRAARMLSELFSRMSEEEIARGIREARRAR